MRTTHQLKETADVAPELPVTRHPSVQAFVDKKVEQARESLKGVDVSVFRRGKKK